VNLDLRSFGEDYMVATAVRTRPDKGVGLSLELGKFEMVDLEEIVRFAESRI
jgi:4'-phosphopantetheinyl transferase